MGAIYVAIKDADSDWREGNGPYRAGSVRMFKDKNEFF